MALTTAWTVSIPDARSSPRDGGDPLGLRAYANRLARDLVPTLTQSTFQTRGFSVLCLSVKVATEAASDSDAQRSFQHLERLWAAASVNQHGDEAPVAGKRRVKRLLLEAVATGKYPLDRPLFSRPFPAETFGAYRRSAAAFGLIKGASGRGTRFGAVRLTKTGNELAKAFSSTAFAGIKVGHWARQDSVSLARVVAAINADPAPSEAEVEALSTGMTTYDGFHDHPLSRLREAFDRSSGGLSLDDLDPASLTGAQASAVVQARPLIDAIEQLEFPLREWVATGERPVIASSVLESPIWELGADEPDVSRLHRRLVDAQTGRLVDAVLQFHQERAVMRGASAWEPGSNLPAADRFMLPDFTLGPLEKLFQEGVAPHASR